MKRVSKRPVRAKHSLTFINRRRSSSRRLAARPASSAPAAPPRRKRKATTTATPLPAALSDALRDLARRVGAHRVGKGKPGTPEAERDQALATEAGRLGQIQPPQAATEDTVKPGAGCQRAPSIPASRPPAATPPAEELPAKAPPLRARGLPLDHHVRALGITKWPDVRGLGKATIPEFLPMLFPVELDPAHGVIQAIERDANTLEIALAHGEPNPDDFGMQLHTIASRAQVCVELYSRMLGRFSPRERSFTGEHGAARIHGMLEVIADDVAIPQSAFGRALGIDVATLRTQLQGLKSRVEAAHRLCRRSALGERRPPGSTRARHPEGGRDGGLVMNREHATIRARRRRPLSRRAASMLLSPPRPVRQPSSAPVAYYGVRSAEHGLLVIKRSGHRTELLPARADDSVPRGFGAGDFGAWPFELAFALVADAIGPDAARRCGWWFCMLVASAVPSDGGWTLKRTQVRAHARAAGWKG
ncbi:hypothetical protein [Sorangium sp. So ce1335]|uniref:hypothetical protein n=1 Tax=Sorangium sp. So ce1335 TaxID=3133335 RepID=UPI003F5F2A31